MNQIKKQIRSLFNIFLALFLIITGALVYWQVAQAKYLTDLSYNPRTCVQGNIPQRGTIYDRNGVKLAYSVPDNNAPCGWKRIYTDPTLAPLIGYYDPTGFGITGLELTYNDILSGQSQPANVSIKQGIRNTIAKIEHVTQHGNDIYLTINDKIQQIAYAAYAGNDPFILSHLCYPSVYSSSGEGSILVEDPKTGEMLAYVSYPDYNPNTLIDHTPAPDGKTDPQGISYTVGQEYFNSLLQNPNKPLIDQPAADSIIPGSIFKTYTLIAAYDSGQFNNISSFDQNQANSFTVDGFTINTSNLPSNVTYPVDLSHAYSYSDNVIFARVASTLGVQTWLSYASRFGLSYGSNIATLPFDVPIANSWIYQSGDNFDAVALANAGYGQASLQVTPLVMSVIDSSVAAMGNIYAPHVLLKEIPYGTAATSITSNAPQLLGQYSPQAAQNVLYAMRADVLYGTIGGGPGAFPTYKNSPVLMGSKTGTGQVSTSNFSQEWFISSAPDDTSNPTGNAPRLSIVVNKINGGEGACLVQIAQSIYEQALPLVGYPLS